MDEVVDWIMGINSWQQVIVLALVLGFMAWRQWRTEKKVRKVDSNVESANLGVAAVASDVQAANQGVAAVAAGVEAGFGKVLHEVENNSGTSMKDAVDRIETGQAELVELFGQHVEKFNEHVEIAKASDERLAALEAKYLDPNDHGL